MQIGCRDETFRKPKTPLQFTSWLRMACRVGRSSGWYVTLLIELSYETHSGQKLLTSPQYGDLGVRVCLSTLIKVPISLNKRDGVSQRFLAYE